MSEVSKQGLEEMLFNLALISSANGEAMQQLESLKEINSDLVAVTQENLGYARIGSESEDSIEQGKLLLIAALQAGRSLDYGIILEHASDKIVLEYKSVNSKQTIPRLLKALGLIQFVNEMGHDKVDVHNKWYLGDGKLISKGKELYIKRGSSEHRKHSSKVYVYSDKSSRDTMNIGDLLKEKIIRDFRAPDDLCGSNMQIKELLERAACVGVVIEPEEVVQAAYTRLKKNYGASNIRNAFRLLDIGEEMGATIDSTVKAFVERYKSEFDLPA